MPQRRQWVTKATPCFERWRSDAASIFQAVEFLICMQSALRHKNNIQCRTGPDDTIHSAEMGPFGISAISFPWTALRLQTSIYTQIRWAQCLAYPIFCTFCGGNILYSCIPLMGKLPRDVITSRSSTAFYFLSLYLALLVIIQFILFILKQISQKIYI